MIFKFLKWTGILLGSILVLAVAFYIVVYVKTNSSINKTYQVSSQKLDIPTDSISYLAGKHVAEIRGCFGCHGNDLSGGRAFADEKSPIGILYSSNLTNGKGGIKFNDEDWVKALRHGLDKNNKTVWFMPSHEIYHISNHDLGALISYVKVQAPVDKVTPQKSLKPLGRTLAFLGKFPLFTAEMIDHSATFKDNVPAGVNPEYGKYLAVTCQGCHGPELKGAPAHSPDEPDIPNISSTGEVGKWQENDLLAIFKTGNTPTRKLSNAMPWNEFHYSDDEVKAIYTYLKTIK